MNTNRPNFRATCRVYCYADETLVSYHESVADAIKHYKTILKLYAELDAHDNGEEQWSLKDDADILNIWFDGTYTQKTVGGMFLYDNQTWGNEDGAFLKIENPKYQLP